MDNWGEIKKEKIEDDDDFWCLYDEIVNDDSCFLNNREYILHSYKEGNLYGLRVDENDYMFKNKEYTNKIFCKKSFYLLPCFCIKENDKCIIIYTHTRARKNGFAKLLLKQLKIKSVYNPLVESMDFWNKIKNKLNIKILKKK